MNMAHIWTSWDKGGAMTEEWMRGGKKEKKRWRLDGYLQTENMEEKPSVLAS